MSDRILSISIVSAAMGVLLVGLASLVYALRVEHLGAWPAEIARLFIVGIGGLAFASASIGLLLLSLKGFTGALASLRKNHSSELQAVAKRGPALLSSATLVGEVYVLLTDKSFQGEVAPTLYVSIVVAILFWLANELMKSSAKWKRSIGWVFWVFALSVLPVAMVRYYGWPEILQQIRQLEVGTQLFSILAVLVIILVPITIDWKDDAELGDGGEPNPVPQPDVTAGAVPRG